MTNILEIKTKTTLQQAFKDKKCTGYLWYSDKSSIQSFKDEKIDFEAKLSDLPFVVEGYLISDDKQSINIKNVDGNYYITVADLGQIDLSEDPVTYKLAKDFQGYHFAEFVPVYKPITKVFIEGTGVFICETEVLMYEGKVFVDKTGGFQTNVISKFKTNNND